MERILEMRRPTFVKGLLHAVGEILETVKDNRCRRISLWREGEDLHVEIVMKQVDFDKFSIGHLETK